MLVKHLLVADFVVDLIVKFEFYAIEPDDLRLLVVVVSKPIDLLIDHLHDLVLVEAVEVSGMTAYDAHLSVREVVITDHSVKPRHVFPAALA